jgi:hypothetical protein
MAGWHINREIKEVSQLVLGVFYSLKGFQKLNQSVLQFNFGENKMDINKQAILIVVSSFLCIGIASAELRVKVSNYWPRTNRTDYLFQSNGTLYSKTVTRNHNVINPEYHIPTNPGDNIISRAYFHNRGNGQASFTRDGVFSLSPNGHVSELGDSIYPDAGTNPSLTWKGTHLVAYSWQGLANGLEWGSPGGNVVGGAYSKTQMHSVLWGPRGGQINNIGLAFSRTRVIAHYKSYTPEYGTDRLGVFRKGGGETFQDVIHVRFHHGSKYPGKVANSCPGAGQWHVAGFSSIVVDIWLSRDGTVIKQDNVLSESWAGKCIGSYNAKDKAAASLYVGY